MTEYAEWQQRVITERDELQIKFDSLSKYLSGNPDIARIELHALRMQREIMYSYLLILNQRIERFN